MTEATDVNRRKSDPILNLREAAKRLKFKDKRSLSSLAILGKVRASKICGRWSFRESWLDEFHDVACRYVTKEHAQAANETLHGTDARSPAAGSNAE